MNLTSNYYINLYTMELFFKDISGQEYLCSLTARLCEANASRAATAVLHVYTESSKL